MSSCERLKDYIRSELDQDGSGQIRVEDMQRTLLALGASPRLSDSEFLSLVKSSGSGLVKYSQLIDNIYGTQSMSEGSGLAYANRSLIETSTPPIMHKRFENDDPSTLRQVNKIDGIRVWISSLQLKDTSPTNAAIQELLYGDPDNSARGADIIAIFFSRLSFSKAQIGNLRDLLRTCLDKPDEYVFNADDKGHSIAGVPAKLISNSSEVYHALYVGVHKSLIFDSNRSGTYELADTFPTPPILACGAPTRGEKAQKYDDTYVAILQHVLVKSSACQGATSSQLKGQEMHILLFGMNLSKEYSAQETQLENLKRLLAFYKGEARPFTAVFIGNTSHRIVCGEEFMEFVSEVMPTPQRQRRHHDFFRFQTRKDLVKSGEKNESHQGKYYLSRAGMDRLREHLSDPDQRKALFHNDIALFAGRDCFGAIHKTSPLCARLLNQLFEMCAAENMEVPMMTFRRIATDAEWSDALGFKVSMPELITKDMLVAGVSALENALEIFEKPEQDLVGLYYPEDGELEPRKMKENLGKALYLQTGWLDGIGVYKNGTCPACLDTWKTHDDIYAFDHVPISGHVTLEPAGTRKIGVWVGSVKLDDLFPSKTALRHLLYSSTDKGASGADIIALYMTDVDVHTGTVHGLQNLLYETVLEEEREQYLFNEQAHGLVLERIPAQLLSVGTKGRSRYVALWICVKKELVGDLHEDGPLVGLEDAFLEPPNLICRTDRKNRLSPSFKAHIAQTVTIKPPGSERWLRLLLVGLNFDTADAMRGKQTEELQQYIHTHFWRLNDRKPRYFAAVIFGDFNNRLVCPERLAPHVKFERSGPTLTEEGAKLMCSIFADPVQRLELMRSTDSWVFNGKDATGKEVAVPQACSELRRLFTLHFDVCVEAPLPTYKRTPLCEILGRKLGFKFEVNELVTREMLVHGLRNLIKWVKSCEIDESSVVEEIRHEYFHDDICEIKIPHEKVMIQEFREQVSSLDLVDDGDDDDDDGDEDVPASSDDACAAVMDCGWPDRLGVLKDGVGVKAKVLHWGNCEYLRGAIKHTPVRGSIQIALGTD